MTQISLQEDASDTKCEHSIDSIQPRTKTKDQQHEGYEDQENSQPGSNPVEGDGEKYPQQETYNRKLANQESQEDGKRRRTSQ
jgi:hypothetical protein